jgi:hypothetical protein
MPNEVAFADNSQLARNRYPPRRITRRVKRAIELIVHEAMAFDEAAREVNFSLRALRLAMNKPHVMAYYKAECEVFRDCRRARNYQRLAQIADDQNNMPAVNAIKTMMGLELEQTNNKQTNASPGVTIRIVNIATPAQHSVELEATHVQHDQINNDQTNS